MDDKGIYTGHPPTTGLFLVVCYQARRLPKTTCWRALLSKLIVSLAILTFYHSSFAGFFVIARFDSFRTSAKKAKAGGFRPCLLLLFQGSERG